MGAYTSEDQRKSKKEGKLKRTFRVYKKGGSQRSKSN
ncbi:MAG: hypothetical protein QT08_C0020G0014 [archaeon GW2011_AR17]|nr:MAG: hypothetical protein QT08_C0020G0014 [archaeon GW2011_AR17]